MLAITVKPSFEPWRRRLCWSGCVPEAAQQASQCNAVGCKTASRSNSEWCDQVYLWLVSLFWKSFSMLCLDEVGVYYYDASCRHDGDMRLTTLDTQFVPFGSKFGQWNFWW